MRGRERGVLVLEKKSIEITNVFVLLSPRHFHLYTHVLKCYTKAARANRHDMKEDDAEFQI